MAQKWTHLGDGWSVRKRSFGDPASGPHPQTQDSIAASNERKQRFCDEMAETLGIDPDDVVVQWDVSGGAIYDQKLMEKQRKNGIKYRQFSDGNRVEVVGDDG